MAESKHKKLEKPSHITLPVSCSPCKADGKSNTAVGYCQYCRHFLCKSCFSYHQNLGKIHVLLDKDAMPQDNVEGDSKDDPCLEMCMIHKHKTIELYCKAHDVVCCIICAMGKHKHCDYGYIPDITETLGQSALEDCTAILKQLHALIGQFENIRTESTDRVKDLDKQKREFSASVRRFRKEIDNALDILEKQAISEMKQVFDAEMKQINENIVACEKAIENLHQTFTSTQHALDTKSGPNRLFTLTKMSSSLNQESTVLLKTVRDNNNDVQIKFDEHIEILKTMKKLRAFGKVNLKKQKVDKGGAQKSSVKGSPPSTNKGSNKQSARERKI